MTTANQPEQPERFEHRLERTYKMAATPEQVWDAIATATGISAWMVPTTLDPQIGGQVSFDLLEIIFAAEPPEKLKGPFWWLNFHQPNDILGICW